MLAAPASSSSPPCPPTLRHRARVPVQPPTGCAQPCCCSRCFGGLWVAACLQIQRLTTKFPVHGLKSLSRSPPVLEAPRNHLSHGAPALVPLPALAVPGLRGVSWVCKHSQSLRAAVAQPIPSRLLEAFPLAPSSILGVITSPMCISCDLSPFSLVLSAVGRSWRCWVLSQGSAVACLKRCPVPSKAVCDSRLNEAPIDNCPRLFFSHPPLDGPPCLINYLPLAVQ